MQPENESTVQRPLTFIEKARRAQIVACAIETIAAMGYARASLAQIAGRAGISKGAISYHFAGKQALIQQVVADVFSAGAGFMRPRIEAQSTAMGMVRAYIESNLEFMRTHRAHITALVEIAANVRAQGTAFAQDWLDAAVSDLERILQHGQDTGEFRPLSNRVVAMTVRSAIDAVPGQLSKSPTLDLGSYAQELVTLFERAIRAQS